MQIRKRIEANAARLTAGERKLAASLLADYPYAGLDSIQKLAERADVSPPSISRFVIKIGLPGYQEFQDLLITELKESQRSPVQVHQQGRSIEGGYLSDFISRASIQMSVSGDAITEAQFDQICSMLSDPKKDVYVLGGRSSNTIAQHLSFHLRQSRRGVFQMPENNEAWPEYLLRMKQGDILFMVDFRRYQSTLEELAEKAANQFGAKVVLMTDKWMSPISRFAAEILPIHIESGTLWGTYAPALSIAEAIVTRIAEDNFEVTSARIEAWDALRESRRDQNK